MKKFMSFVFAGIATLTFNGCGAAIDDYYDDGLTTLFLVDELGYSYAYVPYQCYDYGVQTYSGMTEVNGEFSFYPGEYCEFDFYGYNGVYGDSFDDIVRIVDYTNDGKGGYTV